MNSKFLTNSEFLLSLLIGILGVYNIFLLRPSQDALTYLQALSDSDLVEAIALNSLAPGYLFLMRILKGFSEEGFVLLYGLIVGFLIFKMAWLCGQNFILRGLIYISFLIPYYNPVVFVYSTFRQTIATVILISAVKNKSNYQVILLIALAFLFHYPAVLFYVVVYLSSIAKRNIGLVSLIAGLVVLLFLIITGYIDFFVRKYFDYIGRNNFVPFLKLLLVLCSVVCLFLIKKKKKIISSLGFSLAAIDFFYVENLILILLLIFIPSIGVRIFNTVYIFYPVLFLLFIYIYLKENAFETARIQ